MKKITLFCIAILSFFISCKKNPSGISDIRLDIKNAKYIAIIENFENAENPNTNLFKIIYTDTDTITEQIDIVDGDGEPINDEKNTFIVYKMFNINSKFIYLNGIFMFKLKSGDFESHSLIINTETGKLFRFDYVISDEYYYDNYGYIYTLSVKAEDPGDINALKLKIINDSEIEISELLPKGQNPSFIAVDNEGNCVYKKEGEIKIKYKNGGIENLYPNYFDIDNKEIFSVFKASDGDLYSYGFHEEVFNRVIYKLNITQNTFEKELYCTLNMGTMLKGLESFNYAGILNYTNIDKPCTFFKIDVMGNNVIGAVFFPETKEYKLLQKPDIGKYGMYFSPTDSSISLTNINFEQENPFYFPSQAYIFTYNMTNLGNIEDDFLITSYNELSADLSAYDVYSASPMGVNKFNFSGLRYSDEKFVSGYVENNTIHIISESSAEMKVGQILEVLN